MWLWLRRPARRNLALVALVPRAEATEAFRSLRAALLLTPLLNPPFTLVITGAEARAGTTFVAANLAIALAQAGKRVLLVDANLRRPAVHRLFGIANTRGLSHLLQQSETPDGPTDGVVASGVDNLGLLPAGDPPPDPGGLLSSAAVDRVLDDLSGRWDVVVVDATAIDGVADSLWLAHAASASILVARAGRTRRAALRNAVAALDGTAKQVAGIVVNDVKPPLIGFVRDGQYPAPYWGANLTIEPELGAAVQLHNGRASMPAPTRETWRD
jgi:non-specific protein-tyrosine kinase